MTTNDSDPPHDTEAPVDSDQSQDQDWTGSDATMATDGSGKRLLVEVDLDIDIDGTPVRIVSAGDRIVVDASTFTAVQRLRSGAATLPISLERLALPGGLHDLGVPVETRVAGVRIATLGPGSAPNALDRLVGVAPAHVDLSGVILAAQRRVRTRVGQLFD